MRYLQVARAKKRGFVDRILRTYCTDYGNSKNNGTRITNKIIRRRLKKQLQDELKDIASGR